MAGRLVDGVIFMVVVVAMAALLPGSTAQVPAPPPGHPKGAVTYTVGDTMGWTIPANGAAAYQAWASNNLFEIGDILVFNFNDGAHDVAEVTKTAFDSCNGASTLSISTVPPTRITLTTAGQHFFICTIPGHCSSGQKVAINVTTSSPSGTPPPSSSTAPPAKAATPPPSAATPTSTVVVPTPSHSASTPTSSASIPTSSAPSPQASAVTPAPSTASLPPKAATPSPSASPTPSSTTAPPSSTPTPSAVAASPDGVAAPPTQGNSAASLGVTGVSAVILTAAIALFTFP